VKKFWIFAMVLVLCAGSFAFADDASTLPAGVGRFYVTNTYAFADSSFDLDGEKNDIPAGGGAIKIYNLGLALEYGVTDWISAAIQWAPGVNLWTERDALLAGSETNLDGMADIFAGAKFLIVGEKAPVQNSTIRFAIAPGVKIPLPGTDMQEQFANIMDMDPDTAVTVAQADKHLFALGARAYFDYIINKMFFMNLYSEFTYYPIEGDYQNVSPMATNTSKIAYGYQLVLEAEPHFDYMLDGIKFSATLPVTYVMTPNVKVDDVESVDSKTSVLKVAPTVVALLTKTPLPLEFKLGYSFPIMGNNTMAVNSLTFQAKAYFKF
jgi:opacity protein-like surface antigen